MRKFKGMNKRCWGSQRQATEESNYHPRAEEIRQERVTASKRRVPPLGAVVMERHSCQ